MNRHQIGPIIKYYRERADFTQKELASLLSISESSVRAYESNRALPDIVTIAKIAEILKFDVNVFFSEFKPDEPINTTKVTPALVDITPEEEKALIKLRTLPLNKRNAILTILDIK